MVQRLPDMDAVFILPSRMNQAIYCLQHLKYYCTVFSLEFQKKQELLHGDGMHILSRVVDLQMLPLQYFRIM